MEDEHGVHVSSRTVRGRLFSGVLRGCVTAKKPLLQDPSICKRLAFWRSFANTETGQLNSGTMCCGRMKAPFSFSDNAGICTQESG